jgi:hypothetical protein
VTLFLAAVLPWLYWDQAPDTAPALKEAGIERFYAPAEKAPLWKNTGFEVIALSAADFDKLEKIPAPRVQYRMNVASATRIPWIDANGWRLQRASGRRFYCDAPAAAAAMAAAEAFSYGADALIRTDRDGLGPFARMLKFAHQLGAGPPGTPANMGVIDDGSAEAGEVMNLLARHNLLFRVVRAPDPKLDVNVQLGADAANPALFAQRVRQRVTDEKRLLRIYGSDVVLGHLTGDASRVRLYLLNYGGRPVHGLRIRILGNYPKATLAAFDLPAAQLQDLAAASDATEFTVPEMNLLAVIDLTSSP